MTEHLDTSHASTCCPACREPLDASLGLTVETRPEAGDTSLCAYCGLLLRFNSDLTLRRWTRKEWDTATMLERIEITRVRCMLAFKHILTIDWRFL